MNQPQREDANITRTVGNRKTGGNALSRKKNSSRWDPIRRESNNRGGFTLRLPGKAQGQVTLKAGAWDKEEAEGLCQVAEGPGIFVSYPCINLTIPSVNQTRGFFSLRSRAKKLYHTVEIRLRYPTLHKTVFQSYVVLWKTPFYKHPLFHSEEERRLQAQGGPRRFSVTYHHLAQMDKRLILGIEKGSPYKFIGRNWKWRGTWGIEKPS